MADADPGRAPVAEREVTLPVEDFATPAKPKRRWLRPLLLFGVPLLIAAVAAYVYLTSGRYVSTDTPTSSRT